MKGHSTHKLTAAGFPLAAFASPDLLIRSPRRGPHDDWAVDFVHHSGCCSHLADLVPLVAGAVEPHTDYRQCPDAPANPTLNQLLSLTEVTSRRVELLDHQVRTALGKLETALEDGTEDALTFAGMQLNDARTTAGHGLEDLRSRLATLREAGLGQFDAYLNGVRAQLEEARVRFAAAWWPLITSRPVGTTLTHVWLDYACTPELACVAFAGEPVAAAHNWVVVTTPRLTDMLWWPEDGTAVRLDSAGTDLPEAVWDTYADLVSHTDPSEVYPALIAAIT